MNARSFHGSFPTCVEVFVAHFVWEKRNSCAFSPSVLSRVYLWAAQTIDRKNTILLQLGNARSRYEAAHQPTRGRCGLIVQEDPMNAPSAVTLTSLLSQRLLPMRATLPSRQR